MATLNYAFPTDIGGILRKVNSLPQGQTVDNIFNFQDIDGNYFVRTKKGQICSEEVGIFSDGTDMTSRINAVFAHSKVKGVEFFVDGGGTITVNGTVNIPTGKTLKFRDGTVVGGTGSINGFRIDAAETSQLVAAGSTVILNPSSYAQSSISATWFGFQPDTGVDMSGPLQKAIDLAVNNARVKHVIIPKGGIYNVKDIVIAKDKGTANTGQASVSISGPAISSAQAVTLRNADKNGAIFHFQQVLGSVIRNINFDGTLPYVNPITGDWTQGGTVRTNGVTPSCAINIDGLFTGTGTTLSSSTYYPNINPNLYNNTHFGGSTNIVFKDCNFYNFNVVIATGLSGCPNQEGIRVDGGHSSNYRHFWAAGGLNSRENIIRDHYSFWGDTFVTNHNYGTGVGDIPAVVNCNINILKYAFQADGDFTTVRFIGGYAESMWSVGKSTSNTPVNFSNWNYTQMTKDYFEGIIVAPSPVFIEAKTFSWEGGKIEMMDYKTAIPLSCESAVFSNGVFIRGGVPFMTNPDFFDKVSFKDVYFTGNGGTQGITLDDNSNNVIGLLDESVYNHRYFLPGGQFKSRTNRTYTNVGNKIDRIAVGQFAITVSSSQATATFTPNSVGKFALGDVIVVDEQVNNTGDVYSAVPTTLGYVSAISGSVVTLDYVPFGVTSGTYTMFVARVPYFIGRHIGTVTSGNTIISNVVRDNGSASFQAGDHIKGDGIAAGARVQSVNYGAGTITMTLPATATANRVELGDLKTKVTSNNKPFVYFGSNFTAFNVEVMWFKGDVIENTTGNPTDVGHWHCISAGKTGDSSYAPTFLAVGATSSSGAPATTDASQLTTGTLSDGRLSANIPKKDAANNTFTGNLYVGTNGMRLYWDGNSHIDAAGQGFIVENLSYMSIPGGSLFSSAWDVSAPINANGGVVTTALASDTLKGTGTGMVITNANGQVSRQPLPVPFPNQLFYGSGATVTIANDTGNIWYIVNPNAVVSSLAITLPAAPLDGQTITISFGGTITSGSVVTTLSIMANTGQGILQSTSPTTVEAGDSIMYRYKSSNSKWYRIS